MSRERIKRELSEVGAEFTKVVLHFVQKEQVRREAAAGKKPSIELMAEDNLTQLYQNAYTRALGLVRSLAPERLAEFKSYYEADAKRRDIGPLNFCLQDYFTGIRPNAWDEWSADSICYTKSDLQKAIVLSILNTLDQRVGNALLVLQASLFDRELDTSDELASKGHLRASGAVAGVVLEAHLASVAAGRGTAIKKKHPTIADLNEPLKEAGAYDVPTWRLIQRLADIRNICVHNKGREPSSSEVEDLIQGVRKIASEVH